MEKCGQCGGMGAGAKGICHVCRVRALAEARRKYVWTPALVENLRVAYRAKNRRALAAELDVLEGRTGWPRSAFRSEAMRLGLVLIRSARRRAWTAAEDAYLAEAGGRVSVRSMATRLGRSVIGVQARMATLHVSRRVSDGYSQADLMSVFGENNRQVRRWVEAGLFGRMCVETGRVREAGVMAFLRCCPQDYDLRRVDQYWYKAVLFGR
jgi:hypothetical protein